MPIDHARALRWAHTQGDLLAIRPTIPQIAEHAAALATFFNDAHNRAMMGNTVDMSPADVEDHYTTLLAEGSVPFFLFLDGELVGDADFRHLRDRQAEFTIAIGPRSAQGKGLGRAFALLVHAFAFEHLPLDRVVVAILPHNTPSIRLFQGLGYQTDTSSTARAFAEANSEITLSIARADFAHQHATVLSQLRPADD
jgi:RimJ/RimL family protein N-acetyltransferase